MIDVKATNEKLVSRSLSIICTILECTTLEAQALLEKFKTVKKVIFSSFTGEENMEIIDKYLLEEHGNIRKAIKKYKETK